MKIAFGYHIYVIRGDQHAIKECYTLMVGMLPFTHNLDPCREYLHAIGEREEVLTPGEEVERAQVGEPRFARMLQIGFRLSPIPRLATY